MNPPLRPVCFSFLLIGLLSAPSPLIAELPAGLQQQQNAPSTEAMREIAAPDPQWQDCQTAPARSGDGD